MRHSIETARELDVDQQAKDKNIYKGRIFFKKHIVNLDPKHTCTYIFCAKVHYKLHSWIDSNKNAK